MIAIPPQLRLGLRIGLAIVASYAVALSQDWDRPQWAAIAVMSVSQDSEAASLARGGMRLAATGAAAMVALLLIALFSQERWGFFLGLSLHVGVCGYHMLRSRHGYAWRVAGYVGAVIAISGGTPNAANDFTTALERLQENVTGITFAVLSAWQFNAGGAAEAFQASMSRLSRGLESVASRCAGVLRNGSGRSSNTAPDLASLAGPVQVELARFETLLQPAINESPAIRSARSSWRAMARSCSALVSGLPAWDQALAGLGPRPAALMEMKGPPLCHALAARFGTTAERLAGPLSSGGRTTGDGDSPSGVDGPRPAAVVEPAVDPRLLDDLSPVERAELCGVLAPLRRMVHLSDHQAALLHQGPSDASMDGSSGMLSSPVPFDPVGDLLGPGVARRSESSRPLGSAPPWTPDPVRLEVVVRLVLALWIAALTWFFVPAVPGGAGLVTLVAVFGLVDALAGIRVQLLIRPLVIAYLVSGLIYVLVLPHLEGFSALAILLISVMTLVCYLYPTQSSARTLSMDFLFIVLGITNQQTYSFAGFLTRAASIFIAFGILCLVQEFPWSSSPRRRLLRRISNIQCSLRAVSALLASTQPRRPIPLAWHHYRLEATLHQLEAFSADIARISPAKMGLAGSDDQLKIVELQRSIGALTHDLRRFVELVQVVAICREVFAAASMEVAGRREAMNVHPSTSRHGGTDSFWTIPEPSLDELLGCAEVRVGLAVGAEGGPTPYRQEDDPLYALMGLCRFLRGSLRGFLEDARAVRQLAEERWGQGLLPRLIRHP